MLGRTNTVPLEVLDPISIFGASQLYKMETARPYVVVQQNMQISNKPSECNIDNMTYSFSATKLPVQKQSLMNNRILSRLIPFFSGGNAS